MVQGQKSKAAEMREKTDTGKNWFMKVLLGLVLGLLSSIVLHCKTGSSLGASLGGTRYDNRKKNRLRASYLPRPGRRCCSLPHPRQRNRNVCNVSGRLGVSCSIQRKRAHTKLTQ